MNDLVSVVVTHFNRIEVLERCIRSCIAQGDIVLEILIVDDCSPGLTQLSFKDIEVLDERIALHLLPANRGVQAARNFGIRAARASYIAFMDCDDEWLPTKLDKQIAALLTSPAQLCSCDVAYCRDGGALSLARKSPKFNGSSISHILVDEGHLQTSTLLVEANAARKLLFDEGVPKYQDWDFVIRAEIANFKLVKLDEALSIYHFGLSDQMTAVPKPPMVRHFLNIRRDLLGDEIFHLAMLRIYARMAAEVGDLRVALGTWWLVALRLRQFFFYDLLRFFYKYLVFKLH